MEKKEEMLCEKCGAKMHGKMVMDPELPHKHYTIFKCKKCNFRTWKFIRTPVEIPVYLRK